MKKTLIILTTLLSLFLVSCSSNNTSTKAIEEGKIALVSKEYDKAKDLFTLAVNENSKNTDAKSLLDLTTNYIDLLSVMDNAEFEKSNDLISKIESNDKLDIIKDSFNETKNNINSKKEIFDKYITEIESIEKLLNENKIDAAKSQATAKLEEVKGFKVCEDRLNAIITSVDEKITTAQTEILKYATNVEGIKYKSMMTFDINSGVFAEIEELKGKTMYHFKEQRDLSPREYVYDENTKDVFLLTQGQVFWMNNGNVHLNAPKVETTAQQKLISSEESRQIALNYYLSTHPSVSADDVIVGMGNNIENNEYFRPINRSSGTGKVIAEYYINATTGEIRVSWE